MGIGKKTTSLFLAFVLACSLAPSLSFADQSANDPKEVQEDVTGGSRIGNPVADGESDILDDNYHEMERDDGNAGGDTQQVIEAGQDGDSREDTDKARFNPNEALDFMYVESQIVSLGHNQNIAVALKDEHAKVESARIDLMRNDNQQIVSFEMTASSDNSMLFSFIFADDEEAVGYQISAIVYTLKGSEYVQVADFTLLDKSDGYSFEVVTSEVSDALNDSKADSETTAFVLNDDGSIKTADSIEDAISIADAEGVSESQEAATRSGENARSRAAVSATREEYLIVAINAGHGGSDSGAVNGNLKEKNLTLSIAQAMRDELNTYTGVTAYMVRDGDYYMGLQERVDQARIIGADVFVSVHINAGGGTGAEVWVPNGSSYNYDTHTVGVALGGKIAQQLKALGLTLRGVPKEWQVLK